MNVYETASLGHAGNGLPVTERHVPEGRIRKLYSYVIPSGAEHPLTRVAV